MRNKRKSVIINLFALIILTIISIVFLYYETYLGKTIKIAGRTTLGFLFFGLIYDVFAGAMTEMDEYEKQRRALKPMSTKTLPVIIKNYIIFIVVCAIIGIIIVALSYI